MKTTKRGPGRPKLPASERRVSCTWHLPKDTRNSLRYLAKHKKLSMAKVITQLIDQELLS